MIQPKIQTVYLPLSANTALMVGTIDKYDDYKSFQKERNVEEVKLITFTLEEFKQFKREFGKELLELATENISIKCLNQDVTESNCCSECEYHIVNKESITDILDEFLLNNKI